ncbi:MAG: DUF5678 domain-containing protein [Acidobacteriota bacterium]
MQTVLDEVIEKTANLNNEERRELIRRLLKQEKKIESNGRKNPNPNIEWLKEHRAEYAGNYVALKDGEFIAFGRTIKEADSKAKKKGFDKTLLHYIPAENEEVWGGW